MKPDEFVMSLGHKLKAEYLFEFGVDHLWGDGWWAEFEQAQNDENCPVMVWLKLAVDELLEGRTIPPPDPTENETAWWHKELMSTDRPASK